MTVDAGAPDQIAAGRPLSAVVFSSKSDHWATPPDFYAKLDAEFGFTFDPCPLMSGVDGLKAKWAGRVFCNPPYSAIERFLAKGLWHLSQRDCELLVYLIPARTDTAWFHDHCYGNKAEIRFIRGRLKFGDGKGNAPFPSMLVIFRKAVLPACPLLDPHDANTRSRPAPFSFEGNGRIKVSVSSIVNSPKVQRQVETVRVLRDSVQISDKATLK